MTIMNSTTDARRIRNTSDRRRPRSSKPTASKSQTPRYTTTAAERTSRRNEDEAENAWVLFVLVLFLVLGFGLIAAITYILLLG